LTKASSSSRVLVIGERFNAPPRRAWDEMTPRRWADACLALGAFRDGPSRLKLASVGVAADRADCLNLTPAAVQGQPWRSDFAAAVAALVLPRLAGWRVAYLCGARVAAAFGVRGPVTPIFGRPVDLGGATAVVVPHPSGLNLWWNCRHRIEELRRCLNSLSGGRPPSGSTSSRVDSPPA
jgi:hypothetical protein